jgi:hypothetical protein
LRLLIVYPCVHLSMQQEGVLMWLEYLERAGIFLLDLRERLVALLIRIVHKQTGTRKKF